MIYDRTLSGVQEAKRIREEKVKKGISLSSEEEEIVERGFYTVNTVNRIEAKEQQLTSLLNDMGYYNIGLVDDNKTDWKDTDFFKKADHKRLVDKCAELRAGFLAARYYSSLPMEKVDYIQLNYLEKALNDMERNAQEIKDEYVYCSDELKCGGWV